jgi:predicted secreted protein
MAQTAGKFNGDLLVLTVDGVEIAHSQDATMTFNQDLPDATTKDSSGAVEHIHGNFSWDISSNGLAAFDSAAGAGFVDLMDYVLNKNDVQIKFTTNNAGDVEWRGQMSVASCSVNSPQNAPVSWDASFTGNGLPTKFTIT